MGHKLYVESADKRVFAVALDWPGWARGAKTEQDALEALVAYGRRYKKAARSPGREFSAPKAVGDLTVVERVKGDASTDFGIPAMETKADRKDLNTAELDRQIRVLKAAWKTFDVTSDAAAGVELRKGPRGGGRDVDKIVAHVVDAEVAYLSKVGDKFKPPAGAPHEAWVDELRARIVAALKIRGTGEPPPNPPRRAAVWSLPYAIRRIAWHALDHAWEIEDRAQPAP